MVYHQDLSGPSLQSQDTMLLLSHILKLHQIAERNLKKFFPELKAKTGVDCESGHHALHLLAFPLGCL